MCDRLVHEEETYQAACDELREYDLRQELAQAKKQAIIAAANLDADIWAQGQSSALSPSSSLLSAQRRVTAAGLDNPKEEDCLLQAYKAYQDDNDLLSLDDPPCLGSSHIPSAAVAAQAAAHTAPEPGQTLSSAIRCTLREPGGKSKRVTFAPGPHPGDRGYLTELGLPLTFDIPKEDWPFDIEEDLDLLFPDECEVCEPKHTSYY